MMTKFLVVWLFGAAQEREACILRTFPLEVEGGHTDHSSCLSDRLSFQLSGRISLITMTTADARFLCLLSLAVLAAVVVAEDAPPAAQEEGLTMPEGPKAVVVLTKPVFDLREPNQRWLLEL
jgi:hypothetical protein